METFYIFNFPDKVYKSTEGRPITIKEAPNNQFFYISCKGYLIFEVSTGSKLVSNKSKTLKTAIEETNKFLVDKRSKGILIEPIVKSHIERYGISPKLIQTK